MHRHVARNVVIFARRIGGGWADAGAQESDLVKLVSVKEVGTAEMTISFRIIGVDAGGVDGNSKLAGCRVGIVPNKVPFGFIKAAIRKAVVEVADTKND